MRYRLFCCLWLWCITTVSAVAGQKTWQPLPPLAFDGAVQNVAVNENGILYIGTGNYVYKSTDNGTTWTMIGEDRIWGGVTDIATFPGKPNVVVVSTSTGIYWSVNGGVTWNWDRFEVNPHTGAGGGVSNVHPHAPTNRVFAGTYIMSLNGGWQRTHPEKYTHNYAFLPDGTVLALTGNYQEGEIISSNDGGSSWNRIATLPGIGPMFVDANGRVYAFVDHYTITDNEVIREHLVFSSDDKGTSWTEFTVGTEGLPAQNVRVQLLRINPATNDVYATVANPNTFNSRGIYISTDAMKSWKLLDEALADVRPYELVFTDGGSVVFATETHGITSYNPNRQPAVQSLNGDLVSTDHLNLFATGSGRLIATGRNNGRMRYTDDDGASWTSPVVNEAISLIRALAELPNGDLLLGSIGSVQHGTSPLYRSTDNGTTWQPVGAGIINDSANWTSVNSLFIDNSGKVYALIENSGLMTPKTLLVSDDNGMTWQPVDGFLGSTVVLPDGAIFTVGMNDMFETFFKRSTDGGQTWTEIAGPRAPGITTQPHIFTDPQGNLYFRQHSGDTLFASRDHGSTWQAFDGGAYSTVYFDATGNTYFVYPPANIYLLEKGGAEKTGITNGLPSSGTEVAAVSMTFGTDNTPYLSLSNGRIYKLTEGIATDVGEQPPAQTATVYPNPFAERLTIGYVLPHASGVTLKIFDVLGNEMLTATVAYQNSGHNTMSIDGGTLVPGLYTYRIAAGNFVQSGAVVRR